MNKTDFKILGTDLENNTLLKYKDKKNIEMDFIISPTKRNIHYTSTRVIVEFSKDFIDNNNEFTVINDLCLAANVATKKVEQSKKKLKIIKH